MPRQWLALAPPASQARGQEQRTIHAHGTLIQCLQWIQGGMTNWQSYFSSSSLATSWVTSSCLMLCSSCSMLCSRMRTTILMNLSPLVTLGILSSLHETISGNNLGLLRHHLGGPLAGWHQDSSSCRRLFGWTKRIVTSALKMLLLASTKSKPKVPGSTCRPGLFSFHCMRPPEASPRPGTDFSSLNPPKPRVCLVTLKGEDWIPPVRGARARSMIPSSEDGSSLFSAGTATTCGRVCVWAQSFQLCSSFTVVGKRKFVLNRHRARRCSKLTCVCCSQLGLHDVCIRECSVNAKCSVHA